LASFGASAEFAEVVHPGVRTLHYPTSVGLDRSLGAAFGDLRDNPASFQCVVDDAVVLTILNWLCQ
jgi:hypothetical protein